MAVMETQSEPRLRLKPVPIVVTAALGYGLPRVAAFGAGYSIAIALGALGAASGEPGTAVKAPVVPLMVNIEIVPS
jgi:hypothetical protein